MERSKNPLPSFQKADHEKKKKEDVIDVVEQEKRVYQYILEGVVLYGSLQLDPEDEIHKRRESLSCLSETINTPRERCWYHMCDNI